MTHHVRPREAAALLAGFALWSLTFVLLYASHGVLCAVEIPGGTGPRMILIALWAVMLAAHGALITWFSRRLRSSTKAQRFTRLTSLVLSVAALGATIWTSMPMAALQVC